MNQLVSPNLSVAGEPDLCLLYVQTSFGAPAISPTAWAAWNATQFKHEDRNLPNVAVPLWFEWYGTVEGVTDNFGHVALWTGSEIYTNPLSGSGHEVFPSIEALEQAYGVQFVGWSEDIETLRVVKGDNMTKAEAYTVVTGFYLWGTGVSPTPEQGEYWADRLVNVPSGLQELYEAMKKSSEASAQYIPYSGSELFTKK